MKAVSPLVAVVLLIAVTMTIAGMMAYWASSFVRSRTALWENQTITSECQFADFKIYQCTYNTSASKINLLLENLRDVELKELKLYVLYPNDIISSAIPLNTTLTAGSVQAYYISGITQNFTKVIVKTHCPDVSREDDCK